MLTKYKLTIGSTEYEIPDECLKNWGEISFSLKRTDYSGVMRSYSTEFVFVGEIKDLLWDLYLTDGLKASASVAVYTITDTHTWAKQYEASLDFSTIEIENDSLSINALDNALASLLKSKKSQKYEYAVSSFSTTIVQIGRMEINNYGLLEFGNSTFTGIATLNVNDSGTQMISKEYLEVCDQYSGNSFFVLCNAPGATLRVRLHGLVRCRLCPLAKDNTLQYGDDVPVTQLQIFTDLQLEDEDFVVAATFDFDDDVLFKRIQGTRTKIFVNYTKENVYSTLALLQADALSRFGSGGVISNEYNGIFGIVGSASNYSSQSYWTENTVYEFQNGYWINKGAPEGYYQDRNVDLWATVPAVNLWNGTHVRLKATDKTTGTDGKITLQYASLYAQWGDPVRNTMMCRCITPLELITRIVRSITGTQTEVSIAADDAGKLANTRLLAGEELRQITNAKIYSSFQNFADWISAVFGYTYRVVGDELQFVHRSAVFEDNVVKTIENYRDVSYTVVDDLIYSQVEAGYPKKEYGEIDGRLETNFTNYYTTGYTLTDKKLSLQSKYRADRYGVEFTARKSESETADDKADEDVFAIRFVTDAETGENNYQPTYQQVFSPSVCADNNKAFIAVVGNGAAVTLTMTSSDGNNGLSNITIPADTALFTAGEIEFSTDDMEIPSDLNALVQLDYNGYRIKGFIKEAECRFGRLSGVEYKLIVKEITAL